MYNGHLASVQNFFIKAINHDEYGAESLLSDATAQSIQQALYNAETLSGMMQNIVYIINRLSQAEFSKSEIAKRVVSALDQYRAQYELPTKFRKASFDAIKKSLRYEIERVRDLHQLASHQGMVKICNDLLSQLTNVQDIDDCTQFLKNVPPKYTRDIMPISQKLENETLLLGFEQKKLKVSYTLQTDLLRVISRHRFSSVLHHREHTLATELMAIINNADSQDALRNSIEDRLSNVPNTKQNRTLIRLCKKILAEYSSNKRQASRDSKQRFYDRPSGVKKSLLPPSKEVITTQKVILGSDNNPANIRHIRLMLHGLSDHSGSWNETVDKIDNEQDGAILTVAVDLPGLGLTPERIKTNKLPVQTWCRLTPHIIAELHAQYPGATISVDGHSLGGLIVSEIFPYLESFKTGENEKQASGQKIVTAARMFSPATVNTFFHPMLALLNRKKIEALPRILAEQLKDPIFISKNRLKFMFTSPQVSISAHRVKARFLDLLRYKKKAEIQTPLTIVLGKNDSAVDTDEHKKYLDDAIEINAGHVTHKGALAMDPFNSNDVTTLALSKKRDSHVVRP